MRTDACAVTCLVPTHNRPAFLRRWFRFYTAVPPGFPIVVADSSQTPLHDENSAIVAAHAENLRARMLRLELGFTEKILRALEQIETPFVNLCADDDLILPDAVFRSAEFLSTQPGYVSAQGRTAKIYPRRPVFGCYRLRGYSIEEDDALARCHRLASGFFTNFYAVYRTEALRELFRLAAAHTDTASTYALAEMLLSQLSAVKGRLKVLPYMHLLLERHPAMAGVLIRGRGWDDVSERYARFRTCLVVELTRAGTSPALAEAYVDRQYEHYRNPDLLHRRRRRNANEAACQWLQSVRERIQDHFSETDVRHKRFVRKRDYEGAEPQWHAAVRLMRAFPDGIVATKLHA